MDVEGVAWEDENCRVYTVTPEHPGPFRPWPDQFVHFTDDPKDVKKIMEGGFNLKLFGRSGRKYRVDPNLYQWDPRGVYALELERGMEDEPTRPYVIFETNIKRGLVFEFKERKGIKYDPASCGKAVLSRLLDTKIPAIMAKRLLKSGIDAVMSSGGEQIILNVNKIRILRGGGSHA
jgi:hypothetical protein